MAEDEKYLIFDPGEQKVLINKADSVLELALAANIEIDNSCGGMGSCTTCRVLIREGLDLLPARNELEQDRADERDFEDHERLACQIPPIAGLRVEIPDK